MCVSVGASMEVGRKIKFLLPNSNREGIAGSSAGNNGAGGNGGGNVGGKVLQIAIDKKQNFTLSHCKLFPLPRPAPFVRVFICLCVCPTVSRAIVV